MSTNYFNPISYIPRQPTRSPVTVTNPTSFSTTQNPLWTSVTGYSPGAPNDTAAAPNQGRIAGLVAGLYGSGTPGQPGYIPGLNERAATAFGVARNNARDALRGYGGVSFRENDPSTPNVDESLLMDYQPDQLGRNERQAVLAARAQANARGMLSSGFADQQIGAALQRVGEEARQIVNQYSTQINQIAREYFDPLTGTAATTLVDIGSLYGADTRWAADQALLRPAPAATPTPTPTPSTPASPSESLPNPGTVQSPGEQMVWRGTSRPDLGELRRRHPDMTFRVAFINPQSAGSDAAHYRVFATPTPARSSAAPSRASGTNLWTGRTQPTTDWADSQFGAGNYRIVIGTQDINGRRVPQWRVVAR